MGVAPKGIVAIAPSRTVTGKVPPSSRLCAMKASSPPFWSREPLMPMSSRSIFSRCFARNCILGTLSSWTTFPPTKSKTSLNWFQLGALASAICPLTARISIRSNWRLPSSKRICGKLQAARPISLFAPWHWHLTPSRPNNAEASFIMPNMRLSK